MTENVTTIASSMMLSKSSDLSRTYARDEKLKQQRAIAPTHSPKILLLALQRRISVDKVSDGCSLEQPCARSLRRGRLESITKKKMWSQEK
jgi:hypothetical protein